jgi:hypothetical protein
MIYRFIYELETGRVINAQEIKTATVEFDQKELFDAFNEGTPLFVRDGLVINGNLLEEPAIE